MRNFTLMVFYINFLLGNLNAQTRNDCDSLKNDFLDSAQFSIIKSIVDTIYPNGKVYFKRASPIVFNDLITEMELDPDISFEFLMRNTNFFDSSEVIIRYQQYYKEIIVVGGGYSETYFSSAGGGPGNPCLAASSAIPYILTGMDIEVEEAKFVKQIATINSIIPIDSSDLAINLNLYDDCTYTLTYEISYYDNNLRYTTSLFNALTGQFIYSIDLYDEDINAPTIDFNPKPMNAKSKTSNLLWLVSDDPYNIRTYDYSFDNDYSAEFQEIYGGGEPLDTYIPTVNSDASIWPSGPEIAYQTHWIANEVRAKWIEELNVHFFNCYFMTPIALGAGSLIGNNLSKSRYVIGKVDNYGGGSHDYHWAYPDVIGHEMTHTLLHQLGLETTNYKNKTLHEGIADIFGIYLGSLVLEESIDWIYGTVPGYDDGRVFDVPYYDCFEEVADQTNLDEHERSDPLRYWFYLCVNGDENLGIAALDIKRVLELILISASNIDPNSDYEELMMETLDQAILKYGRCSDEFLSIAKAWEEICVPTGFANEVTHIIPQCDFSLFGPDWVFEEDNYLNVDLVNEITTYHYVWTIIGQKNTGYTSTYGMTGSGQYGGLNIELIHLPTHDYYPQKITIKVYCPELGSKYTAKHSVLILDEDDDDPTCNEYFNNYASTNNDDAESEGLKQFQKNESFNDIDLEIVPNKREKNYFEVYSLLGQLLFEGDIEEYAIENFNLNQLYIIKFYDSKGNFIYVQKTIWIN